MTLAKCSILTGIVAFAGLASLSGALHPAYLPPWTFGFWTSPWCTLFSPTAGTAANPGSPWAIAGAVILLASLLPLPFALTARGSPLRWSIPAAVCLGPGVPLTADVAWAHTAVTLVAGAFAVLSVLGLVAIEARSRRPWLAGAMLASWALTFAAWAALLAGVEVETTLGACQKLTTVMFLAWTARLAFRPPDHAAAQHGP